jgi:uracil-DNA glycosylase
VPKPDWPTAAPFVPDTDDLDVLRAAVQDCRGCPLHENATQAVFGRGTTQALDEAGVDRSTAYVTSAVKHFTFTPRGNRRIHATPDAYEVAACRPWLRAELALVQPELVDLLGATAAKTVYGPSFRVTRSRGAVLEWPTQPGPQALATIHPSAVLRADDRDAALAGLVTDLRVAARLLA